MMLLGGVIVVALVAALGAAALAHGWQDQARSMAGCEPVSFGDCLPVGIPLLYVGVLVVVAAVWLAQRVMGTVNPEWGTVLGTVATTGGLLLHQAGQPRWEPPPTDLAALLAGVGFAVGVAVAAAPLPRLLRGACAVVLVVPLAVYPVLSRDTRRTHLTDELTRVGLPALVPQADGFAVEAATVHDRSVTVTVGRRANVRTDVTPADRSVSIVVVPVPAGFAPPARCGPTAAELMLPDEAPHPPASPPCRPAGPDHWVRVEADDEVHLLRRGAALVLVRPGWNASAADTAAVAGSLVEVPPRRLAELAVD
jgi:hypothetical protein